MISWTKWSGYGFHPSISFCFYASYISKQLHFCANLLGDLLTPGQQDCVWVAFHKRYGSGHKNCCYSVKIMTHMCCGSFKNLWVYSWYLKLLASLLFIIVICTSSSRSDLTSREVLFQLLCLTSSSSAVLQFTLGNPVLEHIFLKLYMHLGSFLGLTLCTNWITQMLCMLIDSHICISLEFSVIFELWYVSFL